MAGYFTSHLFTTLLLYLQSNKRCYQVLQPLHRKHKDLLEHRKKPILAYMLACQESEQQKKLNFQQRPGYI